MSLLNPNLQAFMAIIECSTVHGASKKIGLSQTGVTQRIRALESSLSTSLFTRSRKGMQLTSEGKALHQYCLRAMELEGETLSQMENINQNSDTRLTISAPSSLMRSRVIPACSQILLKRSNLAINFQY